MDLAVCVEIFIFGDVILCTEMLKAKWNLGLDGLMEKLRDPGQRPNYEWIRQRISRTWPMWLKSAKNLALKTTSSNDTLSSRHRKRVS